MGKAIKAVVVAKLLEIGVRAIVGVMPAKHMNMLCFSTNTSQCHRINSGHQGQ